MMKPVLYLDVDGVLNILGGRGEWPDVKQYSVHSNSGMTYYLYLSRRMGEALVSLDVEIRWATTWAEEANEQIAPLIGLPTDSPVICHPTVSDSPFKSIAIRAEVETERIPFIWIDDEAIREIDQAWAKDLGVPHLLVEPNPRRGLTPQHITAIRKFAEQVKG